MKEQTQFNITRDETLQVFDKFLHSFRSNLLIQLETIKNRIQLNNLIMAGKVVCINPKCRAQLKQPKTPFIKCPVCYTDFFVFCHEFPQRVFEHMQCKKCPNEIYLFYCFKCEGLMYYNKYRMGSVCTCKKCGFSACYVVCVHCHKAQCFPPTQRYQTIAWKCEYCFKPFNFMTCDKCLRQVYRDGFFEGQAITCENMKCRANIQVKKCLGCKFLFTDSIGHQYCDPCYQEYVRKTHKSYIPPSGNPAVNPEWNIQYVGEKNQRSTSTNVNKTPFFMNPFHVKPNQTINRGSLQNPQFPNYFADKQPWGQLQLQRTISAQNPSSHSTSSTFSHTSKTSSQVQKQKAKLDTPIKTKQDDLCKICLDRPAEFLNVTCYHMSVCGFCVKSMGTQCPICRAQGGFRKVFT